MFYVYVLQSKQDNSLYVGYTNDLKRRLKEHNEKQNLSTKSRAPFKLVYYEAYTSQRNAKDRESSLKLRGRARAQLLKRINDCVARPK